MILLEMLVYVLKLPYQIIKGIFRRLMGFKNRRYNTDQPHHYICQSCGTANIFQPWNLGKERLVKCPHCRHLNKMPYGSNPKQALVAMLTTGSLVILPWLIWTWLSRMNNTWLF